MERIKRIITTTALLTALAAAPGDEPPLPSLDLVLQRVVERAQVEDDQEREFKARYHFVRARATEFRNAKGELKRREAKTTENHPTGTPAPPRPKASAEAKSLLENTANPSAPATDTHSNVRGRAFEKGEFVLNDDLLGRFEFTLAGRETLNGRTALIVDFQPARKKLPLRSLKDRFINKAAGRVWVDEADYALVKADLHLTERVNVVGGLVGAVWKFTFGFLRERTPDGLWFTRHSNWHLEGREMFVRRTVDYHEAWTEVRRVF